MLMRMQVCQHSQSHQTQKMINCIICFFLGHKWISGVYGIRDKSGVEYVTAKKCKRCGKIKKSS